MEKTANDILMQLKSALSSLKKEVEVIEGQILLLEEAVASSQVQPVSEKLPAAAVQASAEPEETVSEPIPAVQEETSVVMTESVADDLPEEDDLPAAEALPQPEDLPEPDTSVLDIPLPEQPAPSVPQEEPLMALDLPEEEEAIDLGISDFSTGDFAEDFKTPNINDQEASKVKTSVMDVMAEKCAWKTDMPGSPVKNVLSGISLNDRILIVKTLFNEDSAVFQQTIQAFNSFTTLAEAEEYIGTRFPHWDMNSDVVYRFMMAARRKLRS